MLQQVNTQLLLKKFLQNALPSVLFYANYSQQFRYNNFNYTDGRWWTPFSYLGLRLTMPLLH
jgi:outer membrane protein